MIGCMAVKTAGCTGYSIVIFLVANIIVCMLVNKNCFYYC
jgi:hypothetical protein